MGREWQRDGVRLERGTDKYVGKQLKSGGERSGTCWQRYGNDRARERSAESGCWGRPGWKCLRGDMCISISSDGEGRDIEWRWRSEMCSSPVNHYRFLCSLFPPLPVPQVLFSATPQFIPISCFFCLCSRHPYIWFLPLPPPPLLRGISTSPLAQSVLL